MKSRYAAQVAALLIALVLVACGGSEQPVAGGGPDRTPRAADAADTPPAPAAEEKRGSDLPDARPIAEVEMKNYLGAMKEIAALGTDVKPSAKSRDALAGVARAVSWEGEVGAILEKHLFDDLAHFQTVHVSVAAAYAAVAWGEREEFGAAQRARIEELRPHLTDAQYEDAIRSLEQTIALQQQHATDAGPNEDVVEKYRAELDSLFG